MKTVERLERELLTLKELAAILGKGETQTYELARQDRLPVPAIKVGREYRFSRRALDQVLHAHHEVEEAA